MKIDLVAVGTKMPEWVEAAVGEYRKRLPRNFELIVTEIPLARRGKTAPDINRLRETEGKGLLNAVARNDFVVALDVKGKSWSTEAMAEKIDRVRLDGRNLALLVGGPDGLAQECLNRADEIWSLSALTLPHTIVRIVVAEQIYRIWSFLGRHPYHRGSPE